MPSRPAQSVIAALEAAADAKVLADMGPRYGILTERAIGVAMSRMQAIAKAAAKTAGTPDARHRLAAELWAEGGYEARTVAALVDDPAWVTPEQMDAWRADFDNWAICDTVTFKLFDASPHAFARIDAWAGLNDEIGRRAAFALLAACALHGRGGDDDYLSRLDLIRAAATDSRNFVRKGVSWALRAIGGKNSPALRGAARALAAELAAGTEPAARWIGRDALRDFAKWDAKAAARS